MSKQFVAQIVKVNYHPDKNKHTVYFYEDATKATSEPGKGWAGPSNSKAVVGTSIQDCAEKLRVKLADDIMTWGSNQLDAFSFNISCVEVDENGYFWSGSICSLGTSFPVDRPAKY